MTEEEVKLIEWDGRLGCKCKECWDFQKIGSDKEYKKYWDNLKKSFENKKQIKE